MLLFGDISVYSLVAIGIVLLVGMGIHEAAHAYMANWWGDPTPRENGRLTINPIVHINWVGWLMFLLIGFGILGSVPVNPSRMRDEKWGGFWTALAGPLSNLIQATFFAIALRLFAGLSDSVTLIGASARNLSRVALSDQVIIFQGGYPQILEGEVNTLVYFFTLLLWSGVMFNVLLFVFNLLPISMFDGWRVIYHLLPPRGIEWKKIPYALRKNIMPLAAFMYEPKYKWAEWAQYTLYAFFFLFAIGLVIPQFDILGTIIGGPTFRISRFLMGG